jgi:hypothetical protein
VPFSPLESPHMMFAKADWYSVISTLLAVAGLVFGYYWYRMAKREILPRYSTSGDLIIDSSEVQPMESKIELAVGGVPVAQLSRCVLLFWNAGKLTLKGSDVIDGISLELPGTLIGQVKVTGSRDACKPHAAVSGNKIELSFSFLDHGDAIMVSALYDGPKANPELHATIMGVPEGAKAVGNFHWGRNPDLEDEDDEADSEVGAKGRIFRTALFLLAVAALFTKPLWDSYVPFEVVGKYAVYFILIPFAIITFLSLLASLLALVPDRYWAALFARYIPWAGVSAIAEKLEKDSQRPPSNQSRSSTP